MNAADLTALRELHRLISRSFSVHAAYAPALERAIEELTATKEIIEKVMFPTSATWAENGAVELPQAKARPSIEERNAAHKAGVLFGKATATQNTKLAPTWEERESMRVTLAPGEKFRNITNAGKCTLSIPAHWPLPPDIDGRVIQPGETVEGFTNTGTEQITLGYLDLPPNGWRK